MKYSHNTSINEDHYWKIARDKIPGSKYVFVFGHNFNTGGTREGLWHVNSEFIWNQTASTLDLVSTNVNDTIAGTGARKVTISGLDINFLEVSQTIDLDGTNPVTTTQSFLRVNHANVEETGTYGGTNLGPISITRNDNSDIMAFIALDDLSVGYGNSHMGKYTVPANYKASIINSNSEVFNTKLVTFSYNFRKNDNIATGPFFPIEKFKHFDGLSGDTPLCLSGAIVFPPKTDIWLDCWTDGGTAQASAFIEIILTQNDRS